MSDETTAVVAEENTSKTTSVENKFGIDPRFSHLNDDGTLREGRVTEQNTEGRPGPSALEFVTLFNESETRKDAVRRITKAGFHITYNSLVQREKKYRDEGVNLKTLTPGKRGRQIDVASLNASVAQVATESEVKDSDTPNEGESES